jgi:hypothetical protein
VLDIARAGGPVNDFAGRRGGANELLGECIDGQLTAIAGIENSRDPGGVCGKGQGTDNVLDVDEIAGLFTIAKNFL